MSLYKTTRKAAKRARRRTFELFGSDKYSRPGQYDIENKLSRYLDWRDGRFIEAGANDGFNQSNTYWLERFRGWSGILVEPVPENVAECRRNRPKAIVINAALVASKDITSLQFSSAGLMGYVTGSFGSGENELRHRRLASEYQNIIPRDIQVPALTLESITATSGFDRIDLFSLDVEGYELEVLRGMNVDRYRPRYLLIEAKDPDAILPTLQGHYVLQERITPQDLLLRALD